MRLSRARRWRVADGSRESRDAEERQRDRGTAVTPDVGHQRANPRPNRPDPDCSDWTWCACLQGPRPSPSPDVMDDGPAKDALREEVERSIALVRDELGR